MVTPRTALLRTVLALMLLGCSACERAKSPRGGPPAGGRPDVLLITVDTTRADRLGCYGHRDARTPHMDRLAAEGVRFTRAYTVAPLTLPAHASLLTGRVPPATGLHINGAGAGGGMLPAEIPTLASVLKAQGYHTAAFVSAMVLGKSFGLSRGFDHYDDEIDARGHDVATDVLHLERSAQATADRVLAWLGQPREGPYFLWVHFFDPHLPYDPPAPYDKQPADAYDGEIAFMDEHAGRIVSAARAIQGRARPMIVLAGDHGESLGQHGERDHGLFVYDATLHVPLLWLVPDGGPQGVVVDVPVSLVDLFPTILGLLNVAVPDGVHGRNIAGTWRAGEREGVPVYAESEYARYSFGWAPLHALITPRWKYIAAPRAELYDLAADPGETRNVLADHPDAARSMSDTLAGLMAGFRRREAEPVHDAATAARQLAALGYAGTSSRPSPVEPSTARDPKDMLPLYRSLMGALADLERRNYAAVVAVLEPLLARSAEEVGLSESSYDDSLTNLADAFFKLERYEEALATYQRSLRSAPEDPARLTAIALCRHKLGRTDEAIDTLHRVLSVSPDWVPAHRELAQMYSDRQDLPRALPHWKRFAELAPDSLPALTNLGSTLLILGQPQESLAPLLRAVQLDPNNEFIYRSLWQSLVVTGKRTEAIALLRDANRRFPTRPHFVCPLARLLVVTPQLSGDDRLEGLRLAQLCAGSDVTNPRLLDTLAAALAANGQFGKAIGTAERAIEAAARKHDPAQQQAIERHLQLFREGKTVVE